MVFFLLLLFLTATGIGSVFFFQLIIAFGYLGVVYLTISCSVYTVLLAMAGDFCLTPNKTTAQVLNYVADSTTTSNTITSVFSYYTQCPDSLQNLYSLPLQSIDNTLGRVRASIYFKANLRIIYCFITG